MTKVYVSAEQIKKGQAVLVGDDGIVRPSTNNGYTGVATEDSFVLSIGEDGKDVLAVMVENKTRFLTNRQSVLQS